MKFPYLFRLCSHIIFPTSNASCFSSDMGHLIYAIDKHLEFIDFGHLVINKMLDYAFGVTVEAKLLPYLPSLLVFWRVKAYFLGMKKR